MGQRLMIAALTLLLRRIDGATCWCRLIGHSPTWTGSVVACRQCGIDLSTP